MSKRALIGTVLGCLVLSWVGPASAFRVIGSFSSGWMRWDAERRIVDGVERSLDGGLRYSIETGDYADFRDEFLWVPFPPTAAEFENAIARAFDHWTVDDPETGTPASFYFVADLATPAVDSPGIHGIPSTFTGANPGAEIDLLAEIPHAGPSVAASVILFSQSFEDELTLTSGTPHYPGRAISGADIRINPNFVWSLRGFEVLLTHEIGHALGLADLESPTISGVVSAFMDDDYDPTTNETALATLTNSFVDLIDPYDPDFSYLFWVSGNIHTLPGLKTPGIELLMESNSIFDLLFVDPKLQNDEFAGRQFLYPVDVPEPGLGAGLAVGGLGLSWAGAYRRARGAQAKSRS